jgi:hypothetical protein
MPIPNPNPVITPPIPSQDFEDLWLYNILIHSPSVSSGLICVETLPYDSKAQQIGPSQYMVPIRTDQLWKAVSEVPEVAVAMNAIFAAIEPLRAWCELQNTASEISTEVSNIQSEEIATESEIV